MPSSVPSPLDRRVREAGPSAVNEVVPDVRAGGWRARLARNPEWFTVALIVATCAIVGSINPRFFQFATLFDLLHSGTTVSLFALGTLVVLASGGIDVSFTAIAALTMYTITKFVFAWWPDAPFVLILVAGAAGGVLLGLVNGLLVHRLKAPSLIVTIGTLYLYRGILLTFVGTTFFMNIPHSMDHFGRVPLFFYRTADGLRAVLPVSVLALVIAALVTWWLLNRTMMGRGVYAMGGSLAIAERLGYNLRAIHLFVFGYTGMLAGIAGILHVSNNRLANPFDLVGSELDVIAAVILGGARITGGTGTVVGTLLGVALVTLINNVLILVGVPSTWQKVIIGAFILLAGTLQTWQRRNA
ncbi:ABC transporter permease [Paraburkholderia caballeronis]|uniref:Monosaccharide ABC transporter membrane protein, CUT2 family n=1 Tax=Paraburkholderia caballeronis TaxID=416943 RepID=A0A1H7FYM6_9BURK|nr:ABC transporter permease [Paraburkholderia caballeronis]PXW24785.1 monosaccharide ABC transporter membrane protein (CUT2 family) [Paraburkholderia caballeronis]PXX00515.1 monosaccharide ABC transporter membrane protein (CUT2 family) [Paraburkholderia caballeronis]RAJ98578.1 monosaccharide ABC transporter membrane protein (CUT2 family) [Paraburkholderia caballeronis]SEE67311.1 monosaccharide ABC transporter membrane protein, CUT2 family [Paraburkholderia caballeronis]SEK31039.1 monosaccharid